MHLSTSSYDTSNSIYKHLPAANPILPLPTHPTPQITSPKFIFKQPSRTLSIPRKKFQPFPQPPPDQYLSLLKKPSTSQSHSLSPSKKLIKQTFDWNFQCGNLLSAVKIDTDLYRLTLRPDSNSNHQSLWFYFRVRGLKRVRVILSPFRKKTSLYNEGMKVCWREEKGEWRRGGWDIGYEQEGDHYVLGFRFEGMDEKKWTEMAYCVPYGVTELTDYLNRNITLCESSLLKKQVLTTTLLKRPLYLLSSLPSSSPLKPIILITARVHPGETVSSHIIQGILSTLLLSEPNTLQLLRSYELKILPMLNPDGVSLGNYRCSYSGHDLNRKWKDTHPTYHPEVYKIKKMVEMVKERVVMVIDVHGHSRKKGVFFYGCGGGSGGEAKEFPYLMEKCYPETFSYKKSCFKVQADKEGTLRVHLWKKLKIPRVYTMECSFCGSEGKDNFLREDYERVGEELVKGLIVYYSKGFEKRVVKLDEQRSEIIKKFEEEKDVIVNEQSDSGSDSQPSVGIVEQPEIKPTSKPQKPFYRRISFEPTRRQISPPKNFKGFQSVVNQDPRNPHPPPHPSSPIKIKFHPKQPSRPLIPHKKQPSDQRLSNKISTQYKIRISKLLKQTWNNKEEILTNIRSQNEVNFSSEKFFHLSEHRKTETCNFNSELLFPGGREMGKSRGREFFGAQYVRVKKQAEKMNLEKYSSAGERGRGRGRQRERQEGRGNDRSMEQGGTTGKLRLEVRPLTSSKNIIKMELYDQYF